MKKYKVEIVMSYWQTIELEAADEVEAAATALDLFDIAQAREGEGQAYDVSEVTA